MSEGPVNNKLQIGWIGLGNMGIPMSEALAEWLSTEGFSALLLWNRTASKLPAKSKSVKHAESPEALAEQCDVVFTSLATDEAAKSVYERLFVGAKKRAETGKRVTFVETSTLYPTTAGDLERQASSIPKVHYLQCPVFGPPPTAKDRKLVWVVSGEHTVKKFVAPLLVPSMGRKVIDVGSNVERASAFKLNGNMMILSVIETLAESLTLADRTGVSADLMMEFVEEFMPFPSALGYGKKMCTNSFEGNTGFTVEGGLKDASYIRRLAATANATVPIIDIAHRHLITARANGGADHDWSYLVAGPRMAAGLLPQTGQKEVPRDTGFGSTTADDLQEAPVRDGGVKHVKNF